MARRPANATLSKDSSQASRGHNRAPLEAEDEDAAATSSVSRDSWGRHSDEEDGLTAPSQIMLMAAVALRSREEFKNDGSCSTCGAPWTSKDGFLSRGRHSRKCRVCRRAYCPDCKAVNMIKKRISFTQPDADLWQCKVACGDPESANVFFPRKPPAPVVVTAEPSPSHRPTEEGSSSPWSSGSPYADEAVAV